MNNLFDFRRNVAHRKQAKTRFFRMPAILGLLLCAAGLLAIPGKAVAQDFPRGVFSLSNTDRIANQTVLNNPDVTAISIRHSWANLEPTEGVFDWTFLDSEVARAAAAGKQVMLRIGTAQAAKPAWVTTAIQDAGGTFFTFLDHGVQTTIPVFWDPTLLEKKTAMITALGEHFTNNPAVTVVVASFANCCSEDWGVPHTPVDVINWLAAGYTSERMIDAGRTIIDATMAAFPNQYVTLAVGGNGEGHGIDLDPTDDYVARNAVLNARASWPGRLFAQRNSLSTCIPPAPGTDTPWQMIWDFQPLVGAQMLYPAVNDPTYRDNCGVTIDPALALTRSVDAAVPYGIKFIEIYQTDVINLPLAITYAHDALTALPTPTPTPTDTPTPTPTPPDTPTPTPTPPDTPTPTPTPPDTPTPTPTPTTDLWISVTDGQSTAVAGQNATYTIMVVNLGPSDVTGAVITDSFPDIFSGVIFTATQNGGASGFTASGTGNINDTVTMPVGSAITYRAIGGISSSATGTLSNTATVTPPIGVPDPDLTNNSATDTDTIIIQPDLRVTVTDGRDTVAPGQSDTYTITVRNNGPSNVTGAVVTDQFPDMFTGVTFTATQTGGASGFTASGTGNINDIVTMPTGSVITYSATGTISQNATGTLSDTATVTPPIGVTDPDLTNNSATDTDSIVIQADLRVTVTDGRSTVAPGQSDTYTITVRNNGPSNVTGAVVTDNFPAMFTGVTFTATQTGGASGFTASGAGNINDTVTMPTGSVITYSATGTISQNATGTLSDTVTVTAPIGVTDPNLTNNSATDTDTIIVQADLKVTITDGRSRYIPGQSNTYTIMVTNLGPSYVTGAAVTDIFPDLLIGVTFTATQTGGASGFTASGVGNINDTVIMPAGSVITYSATGTVSSSATGPLSDTITVTAPVGVTDPNLANNSKTDTDNPP